MNARRSRPGTWVGLAVLAGVVAVLLAAGCQEKAKEPVARPPGTMGNSELTSRSAFAATQGTIGAVAYLETVRLMRVRGYGLVSGLVDKGSRRCQESLREYMTRSITRHRLSDPYRRKDGTEPSPSEVIESLDTAVVMVEGEIPVGAGVGRRFDVRVTAVDEDTQSLVGGVLIPCELKVFRSVAPGAILEGRTRAQATGPIFINPFHEGSDSATVINLREGRIIGGGTNSEARPLRLDAVIESYATVRQIKDAINLRFKSDAPVADADSPSHVAVRVPPEYRGREARFVELMMYLPLSSVRSELEARTKALVAQLAEPDAAADEISLALEGIGPTTIPTVRPLYTHPRRQVNYYAARAGIRLGDEAAIDILARHARDVRSRFRFQAIRELGDSGMPRQAGPILRELLADTDAQVRVLAYEALRDVDRSTIAQFVVGQEPENFLLEVLPCEGRPMIYARRSRVPRIAILGGDRLFCRPPLLYAEPDSRITLSARADENRITVLRKDPAGVLGPYEVPLSVSVLTSFLGGNLRTDGDGRLKGLGLDYGTVLAILYRLCEKDAIPADIKWEDPSMESMLGPLTPIGRPESEL